MKDVIENAAVLYKSGVKRIYDAIQITKKGIYTGCIITNDAGETEFEDQGFIPRDQIQKIMIVGEHGKVKDIDV